MAATARGYEFLESALQQMSVTKDAKELRVLQAVVFPLKYGMSTQETAKAIGMSVRWTTQARSNYIRNGGVIRKTNPVTRNRAYLSKEEEKAFLSPFFDRARRGGILVVTDIHKALEERLSRKVAVGSAYNMLHRNGWRKLVPDKRNIATDVIVQNAWKKNSPLPYPS